MPALLWFIPITLVGLGWMKWSTTKPLFSSPRWRSVSTFLSLLVASIQCLWFLAMYIRPSRVEGFAIEPQWFYAVGRFCFWLLVIVGLLTIPSRKGTRVLALAASTLNFISWFAFSMSF